eukprot:Tbor_TRINITY_DN3718_c0_g1::TRINITY_DN3718_c0_g1_i1::g.2416::m.2416
MIILLTVDGDNHEVKYTMSCDPAITLLQAISQFRINLRLPISVAVTVVSNQGEPLPLHDTLNTIYEHQQAKKAASKSAQDETEGTSSEAEGTKGDNGAGTEESMVSQSLSMVLEMYALLDGPEKCVRSIIECIIRIMKKLSGDESKSADYGGIDKVSDASEEETEGNNGVNKSEDSPELLRGGISGLHVIKSNGRFQKGYCIDDVSWGGIIIAENALVSVLYPTQMAEIVMRNERLRTRTFDPNAFIGESSISGVDNEEYNKYVSIARTYGNIIKTNDEQGAYISLYPDLTSIRHSCYPNSVLRVGTKRPYRGVIRCATPGGLRGGGEVTVLYSKVSTVLFLLMPKDRRKKAVQEKYHFTCDCCRCCKEESQLEATLTGAFFYGNAIGKPTVQGKLAKEMREDFEKLHVIDPTPGGQMDIPPGSKIPKAPTELLNFVTKYTSSNSQLKLHQNHWRLSCVRRAYIKQVEYVIRAQSKQAKSCGVIPLRSIIEKRSFDVILQQIATEMAFIPPGHPFYLSSYKVFMDVMRVLPARLCASVQLKARNTSINWESLTLANETWQAVSASTINEQSESKNTVTSNSGTTYKVEKAHDTNGGISSNPTKVEVHKAGNFIVKKRINNPYLAHI